MENYKWDIKEYDWGKVGQLKEIYRTKDCKIKYSESNYWPIDLNNGQGIDVDQGLQKLEKRKKDFILKYWEFKVEDESHDAKAQRNSTEYNFIIEGEIRGDVGGEEILLRAGDFIIIRPGVVINLQKEIRKPTKGITIKVPGIENDEIKSKQFKNK